MISLFFQQLSKLIKAKLKYEIKVSYLKQNRSKLHSQFRLQKTHYLTDTYTQKKFPKQKVKILLFRSDILAIKICHFGPDVGFYEKIVIDFIMKIAFIEITICSKNHFQ